MLGCWHDRSVPQGRSGPLTNKERLRLVDQMRMRRSARANLIRLVDDLIRRLEMDETSKLVLADLLEQAAADLRAKSNAVARDQMIVREYKKMRPVLSHARKLRLRGEPLASIDSQLGLSRWIDDHDAR